MMNAPIAPGVAVDIRDLCKSYDGRRVLDALTLSLHAGEFTAIVGRSGCGKSTLLRHLIGLERPDSGEVFIDGVKRSNLLGNARIMFQEPRLLPWKTVLANVGIGLSGNWQSAAVEALQSVGLGERAKDWPYVLSGGQKQRVSLARALAHAPQFLLLDEPMGALDALTRLEMQRLIERLWQERGFTALLVTHDVGEAITLADRIVLLDDGRVTKDVPVNMPRPRQRGGKKFAALEAEVLDWIMSIYMGFI
ncbi:MAG: ATP-binding cassette domain-containing protein [Candidatus Accumulibacter sp.]|jgi:sulfonate transport system ATP-binding protein|nr:ATP-binding cassette domain-containing protein [Accumulibacter sp.]